MSAQELRSRPPKRARSLWRPLSLALTLTVLGGSSVAQAAPAQHVITMRSMSYGRLPSGIRVGDTIVWVNRDNVAHTATARNRGFNVNVLPGRSVRIIVRQAGTFAFYCAYHPTMRGTITFAQ